MGAWLRTVAGIVVGVVLGGIIVFGVETVNSTFFPLPQGIGMDDPVALGDAIARAGPLALVGVLAGWALGTFAGAWVATLIARPTGRLPAVAVGGFFLAGALMNLLAFPHPVWFWIVGLALFAPAALLGDRAARGADAEVKRPA